MDITRHVRLAAVVTAAAALQSMPARAADLLYAYDAFDYSPGSLLAGQNGGIGWTSPWSSDAGATNSGIIVGGLAYTDAAGRSLPTGGGAFATQPAVFFAQATRNTAAHFGQAGTSVWLSFLVQQSAQPLSGVNYAEATVGTGYSFGAPAMAGGLSADDAAVNPFYVTNVPANTVPDVAPANGTSFIVLRWDFSASGNDTLNLWIDPLLDTTPTNPDASGSLRNYAGSISGVTLGYGDNRRLVFDEVRVGSSFAAVVGAVPEPESWAMLLTGLGLSLQVARRRGLRDRARALRAP